LPPQLGDRQKRFQMNLQSAASISAHKIAYSYATMRDSCKPVS
jgi:hypothetical protein